MTGTALVVAHTLLQRDPRVARQIRWLTGVGWTVDTIGQGSQALPGVREHFEFAAEPVWLRPSVVKALIHIAPMRTRFRLLVRSRLPKSVIRALRADAYDLVLMNDIVPLRLVDELPPGSDRVHLDLHEFHAADLDRAMRGATLANRYHQWARAAISSPHVRSRSVVAPGIARLYSEEFGVPEPEVIRNCPPFERLAASPVNPDRIDLVYHGAASWDRGLKTLIDAMAKLSARFRLNLILVGPPDMLDDVAKAIAPLGDRARILPPVPMNEITGRINEFDLEVMFYPPKTANLRLALPNKLFEAIQARLGVAIGRSPMMAEVVEQYRNGLIVDGWTSDDLVAGLEQLSAIEVQAFKDGSDAAARNLNSENEEKVFQKVIGSFSRAQETAG